MRSVLQCKNPAAFSTRSVFVEADPHRLDYRGIGQSLSFSEMMLRRRGIRVPSPHGFSLELANLGVSVHLTLRWQECDYLVLVRQRRADRGDRVLKLISGYVPSHELDNPLQTALHEVAEECLLQTPQGWLSGCFDDRWMPSPYPEKLAGHPTGHYRLVCEGAGVRSVTHTGQPLPKAPDAYVHLPTASLQLLYRMRLELPPGLEQLSLWHVDERLCDGVLQVCLDTRHSDLYLLRDEQGMAPRLLQLRDGRLESVDTAGLWLSEAFARRQGWVITDERISWQDWSRSRCAGPG